MYLTCVLLTFLPFIYFMYKIYFFCSSITETKRRACRNNKGIKTSSQGSVTQMRNFVEYKQPEFTCCSGMI